MNPELDNLSLPELLERLEDITSPKPVSYFPQTDAWLVLAGIIVLALLYFGWWMHHQWRNDAYRREALAELLALELLLQRDDTAFESGVAELLRRTALAVSPRLEVVSLQGEIWLSHLDRQMGGAEFTDGIGRALLTEPYRRETSQSAEDRRNLLNLARRWLQNHHRMAA